MAGPSGDPIPTITEAAATGAVKATYEDIRDSLNIGVVNLIWRHFARPALSDRAAICIA